MLAIIFASLIPFISLSFCRLEDYDQTMIYLTSMLYYQPLLLIIPIWIRSVVIHKPKRVSYFVLLHKLLLLISHQLCDVSLFTLSDCMCFRNHIAWVDLWRFPFGTKMISLCLWQSLNFSWTHCKTSTRGLFVGPSVSTRIQVGP